MILAWNYTANENEMVKEEAQTSSTLCDACRSIAPLRQKLGHA